MPIYEFECSACGARFESIVAAGTESLPCEQCGAGGAPRVISGFAAPTRQMTAGQRRRAEERRGVDRDGAKRRWQRSMDRARGGEGRKRPPGGDS